MDEKKTFPKVIGRAYSGNPKNSTKKTLDFSSNLCLADTSEFAMIHNRGGGNSRQGGWPSGIRIAITDGDKYVRANLPPELFVAMEEIAKKNLGQMTLLPGPVPTFMGNVAAGTQTAVNGLVNLTARAVSVAESLLQGKMKLKSNVICSALYKGGGQVLDAMGTEVPDIEAKALPVTVDWNYSQTRVNTYDRDEAGLCLVTLVTINRTGLYKGNPSRYPWYFQVDQFRAKEKKSPNGTLQYEGSTVKDKVSAFINVSDDDALKLFHRVNRFVELWEIAYGIPLIKEGGKMLDAERGNYQ